MGVGLFSPSSVILDRISTTILNQYLKSKQRKINKQIDRKTDIPMFLILAMMTSLSLFCMTLNLKVSIFRGWECSISNVTTNTVHSCPNFTIEKVAQVASLVNREAEV